MRIPALQKKACTVCGTIKPFSEFGPRPAKKDGRRSDCKACVASASRARTASLSEEERRTKYRAEYANHREKKLDAAKAYNRAHPDRVRANGLRSKRLRWATGLIISLRCRARRSNLEFNLTTEALEHLFDEQGGRCFWFGLPMKASIEKRDPLRPSVDRLDNTKGYTIDNIVLTCMFANMGRSSMSVEQMHAFVASLRMHYAT